MTNIAVRVENLAKEYKIGHLQSRSNNFREVITNTFSAPFRRVRDLMRGEAYGAAQLSESIWALQDINFEVQHGEVLGIIGHNGAGKSTLLKVLSQITEPTKGKIDLYGRVGALLEVGTGFHQELTGRENVYLNGAILGMTRNDIDRKFDEIVDFAGVEKFIDTPVKHYSSGMRLRLGFAVAAFLEPEILIIDEVLAVGDAAFQRKCLGKMDEVAGEGRTVLFVSHNMAAITQLCQRVIILNHGQVVNDGLPNDMVHQYLYEHNSIDVKSNATWMRTTEPNENQAVVIQNISVKDDAEDTLTTTIPFHHSATITIEYEVHKTVEDLGISIGFDNSQGIQIFETWTVDSSKEEFGSVGRHKAICQLPSYLLIPDQYFVRVVMFVPMQRQSLQDSVNPAFTLTIEENGFYLPQVSRYGVIAPKLEWSLDGS